MKILFFSYYFPPDIGAGSFRADSLINHLLQKNCSVTLICAQPNRYKNIKKKASSEIEIRGNLTIKRVPAPIFFQNLFGQALVFPLFILKALLISRNEKPSLVIGTSSRLGTAFIAAISSIFHKADLVLDIRDIIIETISYSKIFKPLKKLIIFFLFLIEKLSVSKSSMLNLVSPAFNEYYINKYKYPINQIFNFQNGIDESFVFSQNQHLNFDHLSKTVLYAGNIGFGQALSSFLPEICKKLEKEFCFKIIGDGSDKSALVDRCSRLVLKNINFYEPVTRDNLLEHYRDADILFVNIDCNPAFARVIPSKLFEYLATGKPVVAGLHGFSAQYFNNIPGLYIFDSSDVTQATKAILHAKLNFYDRSNFIKKNIRENIAKDFASTIKSSFKTA